MNLPSCKTFCLLATAILALLVAACAPAASPAATAVEEQSADAGGTTGDVPDDPIRIGALAPLSAPGSVVAGEAISDAMNIAIDEINAAGGLLGQQVKLVIFDSEGLPERGTAGAERLINQDNVIAIAGGSHSSVGVAAKEVAHDNGIPIVLVNTWNDTITSVQYPEVFRIAPLSSEVSTIDVNFMKWLRDDVGLNLEKVVLLTENTDYGIPAAEDTSRLLTDAGIDSVTFGVDIGTQDFAGIIERIKAENPDLIMSLATGEASYNFAQQSADAGIGPQDVPTICDHVALVSDAFWSNVPDGNYCFVRRIGLPPPLYNDFAHSFLASYEARTGKVGAESYAFAAYDAIRLIAQAVTEAGTTEAAAIITALENITYEGALGTITFPINSSNTPQQAGVDPKWWHQFPDPAVTIVQYQVEGEDSEGAAVVYPQTYRTGEPVIPGQ
ncbi:MAG: ABC transporter substrate-binding protein [Caldilineaceae bacterium]|nr:ABC transporter substrate-binding protein [Caldilineaceae bacterium]MCY4115599.1 ABC transporter substrate-binding protein [Caldilineaceae bacterium]MDE0070845.1 ABC transporter substrate-binding protein [Caldilineaceae bacterium]MDE0180877.1 ABC transporter substrate-binding protein [Caldilineaceae bacterium]MDE0432320.1 ABC transporter substrate-binding protein [Caldilineaceae bacterium]